MIIAILVICISFIAGLVLYIWTIRYDLKMRHQRGKRNFFMKRVERIGDLLMTLSLAFPTVYAVLQRPYTEQVTLSIIALSAGCLLLTTLGITDKISKREHNIAFLIVLNVSFFLLEVGLFCLEFILILNK
jgi:hypothetical protein